MQRADPPEGYREAITAHRATWNTTRRHTSPEIQAAAERQLRDRIREPEENFADGRQADRTRNPLRGASHPAAPPGVGRPQKAAHIGDLVRRAKRGHSLRKLIISPRKS